MDQICTKCLTPKTKDHFYKLCCGKDGYRKICKLCMNKDSKEYHTINHDILSEYHKNYSKQNKDTLKIYREEFYKKYNKGGIYEDRRKITSEKRKIKIARANKSYREKNKDAIIEYQREYRKKNKDKLNAYKLAYHKASPHIKAWRTVLRGVLIRFNKPKEGYTIDLLGYSALDFKIHIENLFTEGMSWDNYGKWHIDHKKGVKEFHPDTPMHIVNALNNLQPLWAIDNLRKH